MLKSLLRYHQSCLVMSMLRCACPPATHSSQWQLWTYIWKSICAPAVEPRARSCTSIVQHDIQKIKPCNGKPGMVEWVNECLVHCSILCHDMSIVSMGQIKWQKDIRMLLYTTVKKLKEQLLLSRIYHGSMKESGELLLLLTSIYHDRLTMVRWKIVHSETSFGLHIPWHLI